MSCGGRLYRGGIATPHPHANLNADLHADDDPHRHSDGHPHPNADSHAHLYADTHADAIEHGYRHANLDADSDTQPHADA